METSSIGKPLQSGMANMAATWESLAAAARPARAANRHIAMEVIAILVSYSNSKPRECREPYKT